MESVKVDIYYKNFRESFKALIDFPSSAESDKLRTLLLTLNLCIRQEPDIFVPSLGVENGGAEAENKEKFRRFIDDHTLWILSKLVEVGSQPSWKSVCKETVKTQIALLHLVSVRTEQIEHVLAKYLSLAVALSEEADEFEDDGVAVPNLVENISKEETLKFASLDSMYDVMNACYQIILNFMGQLTVRGSHLLGRIWNVALTTVSRNSLVIIPSALQLVLALANSGYLDDKKDKLWDLISLFCTILSSEPMRKALEEQSGLTAFDWRRIVEPTVGLFNQAVQTTREVSLKAFDAGVRLLGYGCKVPEMRFPVEGLVQILLTRESVFCAAVDEETVDSVINSCEVYKESLNLLDILARNDSKHGAVPKVVIGEPPAKRIKTENRGLPLVLNSVLIKAESLSSELANQPTDSVFITFSRLFTFLCYSVIKRGVHIDLSSLISNAIDHSVSFLSKCESAISLKKVLPGVMDILLYSSGVSGVSGDVPSKVVGLMTLPWMVYEVVFIDLTLKNKKVFEETARRLDGFLDMEMKIDFFRLITRVQIDACPQWRVKCLKFAIQELQDKCLSEVAVEMPWILHNHGSAVVDLVLKTLIKAVGSKEQKVQELVAEVAPLSVCAVAKTTYIVRSGGNIFDPPFRMQCKTCHGVDNNSNVSKQKPLTIPKDFIESYVTLLRSETESAAVRILNAVPPIAAHASDVDHCGFVKEVLPLLEHQSVEFRMQFAEMMGCLLPKRIGTEATGPKIEARTFVLDAVETLLDKVLGTQNPTSLRVLTTAVLSLTRSPDPLVQSQSCHFLLKLVLTCDSEVVGTAQQTLRALFKQVYMREQSREFFETIADCLLVSRIGIGASLSRLLSTLDGRSADENVETIRVELVPLLVARAAKGNGEAKKVLEGLPNLMASGMTLGKLLMDAFPNIWVHAILYCSRSESDRIAAFLQANSGYMLNVMRATSKQALTYHLLLHNTLAPPRVMEELATLASIDGAGNLVQPIVTPHQKDLIAETVQTRFLGVLVHLVQRLSQGMPVSQKMIIFQSFPGVFRILGSKIVSLFQMKILSTLRLALSSMDELSEEVIGAWDSFVRHLSATALASSMLKIAASLWPYREAARLGVHKILRYMIVDNSDITSSSIAQLIILDGLNEFDDISRVVLSSGVENGGLKDQLSLLLMIMENEDEIVRVLGLRRLKEFLKNRVAELHCLVLSADSGDALVSKLVTTLCARYHDAGSEAKILFAECLGLVGAIEPTRLTLPNGEMDGSSKTSNKIHQDICTDGFALELFNRIYTAFLQSASSQLTTFSYTVQELFKSYGIDSSLNGEASARIWDKMPEQMKTIFRPFLSTLYQTVDKPPPNRPRIIYGSKLGMNHSLWRNVWVEEIVSKVQTNLPKKIFISVLPTLKKSNSVQVFMLPYIVAQALLEADPSVVDQIHDEVITVLSHTEAPTASLHTIFIILDHLCSWLAMKEAAVAHKKNQTTQESLKHDTSYWKIKAFLKRMPDEKLAEAAARAGAYARAIRHLESHVMAHPDSKDSKASFLQELYVCLDEPDGVIGASTLVPETSVDITIRAYEATGDFQSAIAALRAKLCTVKGPESTELKRRIAKCYLELNQPDAVLEFVKNASVEFDKELNDYRAEASWRLGDWAELETLGPVKDQRMWGAAVGAALVAGRDGNGDVVQSVASDLRAKLLEHASVAILEKGWYQRAYPDVVKLAIVTDLEAALSIVGSVGSTGHFPNLDFESLLDSWKRRQKISQSTVRVLEPMMTVRRVALKLIADKVTSLNIPVPASLRRELATNLSYCVRLAREAGQTQRALSYILETECSVESPPPSVMLEKAKWQWMCGQPSNAIKELQTGIARHFPNPIDPKTASNEIKLHASEAKLLLAKYLDTTDSLDNTALLGCYKEALAVDTNCEESLFEMAMFYDRSYQAQDDKDKNVQYLGVVCNYLGKSLEHGSGYIYRSLPRMLTVWFDLGAKVCEMQESNARLNSKKILSQITEVFKALTGRRLPSYKLLTALSQMLSRICHPHPEVWDVLKGLLSRVLRDYPQQSVWIMMVMIKSTHKSRTQRCAEVTKLACDGKPELKKFIQDATKLTEKLIEVAERRTDSNTFSLNEHFKDFAQLLKSPSFSQIIIPMQKNMTETLPVTSGPHREFCPFPGRLTYITGIEDEVEVLNSLQKPKKFNFLCSDGRKYAMMAKPKDDLRKDARVMEFHKVVNRLLRADNETRRRDLYIRTYVVVALNEETGLVEWLPNLHGLRPILLKLYANRGVSCSNSDLKRYMPGLKDDPGRKLDLLGKLCSRFSPCLGDWFSATFQDAKSWLIARHNYVRTTAVISMVGFILGLGDRHGENILIDSVSGDTCHVDYNCLFNKGETFEWPERVPFRLTKNMVHAMGVTGFEGVFRRCAEATMRVMRNESDTLITVLRPLVHDPLVEWAKAKKATTGDDREFKSEKAMEVVRNIELRLQGAMVSRFRSRGSSQKLSIDGQVNQLILEATSKENLSLMYFGWAAYF